ncbi:MAG: hypothetical protein ABSA97_14550 [Verrucomicrobiia bacterium]
MTRNGKIARLPREVREQLNRRLDDGEKGRKLVRWLNSLPPVQTVLKAEFGGRSINEPNLTEWKKGGYREWLDQQEAKELVPLLADEADELNHATGPPLTDRMAVWLAARLMVVVRRLAVADLDDAAKWKLLHEAAADIVAFRKGDHSGERLKLDRELLELDRERLDLDRERLVIEKERTIDAFVNIFRDAARKDPRLLDAAEMLCHAIVENTDPAALSYVFPSERKSSTASAAGEAAQPGAPTGSSQIKVN